MKKLLSLLLAIVGFGGTVSAQCAYNNTQTGVTLSPPTTVGVASQLSSCVAGGQFLRVSGLSVGSSYTISTCGDTDFDTQITVYPAGGGSVIAYNDDFCGAQSSVTFVATSANTSIDVLIDRYNCLSNSLCMTVNMTLVSAPAADPCATAQISSLACGVSESFTLAGSGFGFSPGSCGFTTPGAEKVYTFTAATSGAYTLNVTSATGGYVDYFIKDASLGCSGTGWTCIDDLNAPASVPFNVVAGTTYYILVDGEGTSSRSQTFNIGCIALPDPCANVDTISCGTSATFSLQGSGGGWNVTSCFFTTPGAEQVYFFNAPTTGTYTLNVTSATGGYVDYFFKSASAGCGSTGWSCIDDFNAPGITTLTLTAGTYYILVDGEDVAAKTQTFSISCPAPPPANDDCANAISITCGSSVSGSTLSATPDVAPSCNGFTVGTGGAVWYKFIGTGGIVTVSTCDPGTTYDSRVHIYEGNCTTPVCVTADDDGCNSPTLASVATFCTSQGTEYFVLVNGFLAATGNFVLSLDCNQPTVVINPIADRCHDDASVTLGANIPGGTFTVNGVAATTFDPATAPDGPSTIIYSVCGLSDTIIANVTPTPSNDLCANAIAINCGDVVTGSTVCATADVAPICGTTNGTGGGVWYSFVGNGNSVTASLCQGSNYDTKIRVFTGSCGALVCQTGVDDACGLQSEVSWCSEPGVTYFILVHGFGSAEGSFSLALTCTASAPVITTCPGPQVGNLDAFCSFVVPDYTGFVSSTDDCGTVTVSQSPAAGTVLSGAGVNTVTFVVTDLGGNTDTCSTTLTLEDITAPTAVCNSYTAYLDAVGFVQVEPLDLVTASTDNCGIDTATGNCTFFCSEIGANSVLITVIDINGNTSTCTSTVTVLDTIAPAAVCVDISITLDATGNASIVSEDLDGGSFDNCSINTISANQTAFGCSNVGNNTVTLTVVDGSGNISTCTSTVTVGDDTAPIASCQNVTLTLDDNGNGCITPAQVNNGSSDACGIASLSLDNSCFGCSNLGSNAVVLTVTDVNGNVSTCSAEVTVIEGHFVEITCPADITTTCETGEGGAYVSWSDPTAIAFNSCSDPCPAQPVCYPGFTYIGERNGHRYYVKNNGVNWNTANTGAQAIGGYLVTINDAAENTWLRNSLGGNSCGGGTFWTGYNDVAVEGSFQWANGEVSAYSNWASGEPNNNGGSNCCGNGNLSAGDYGVFQQNNGLWYDRRGCNSYGYIVEINCGNPYTITQIGGPASGSLFPQGTTVITYVAADTFGTTDTCSFNVTVEEVFEIICPGNVSIACQNACGPNGQNGANVHWNDPILIWETCAREVCTANTCIPGFDFLGTSAGRRYFVSNSAVTWNNARNAALAAGYTLASIDDATENNWLKNALAGSNNYWIGYNDVAVEGSFVWTGGSLSTYTNWATGEPNNGGGNQDFVSFNASSGRWSDRGSNDCYKFIMEQCCNSASMAQTAGPAEGSFQAPGTYTVTYTATTTTGLNTSCSFDVTVLPCPLNYCNAGGNSCYEWIRQVNLCNLDNWSGNNGGYEDFTQYSATVNRGSSYTINLRPAFSGSSQNEFWAVYFDWNQDGDFSDTGELAYSGNGTGLKTGTVNVPNSAATGNTRMRVMMRRGCAPSGPCGNVGNGEVEDYTITVVGSSVRAAATANGQSDAEGGAESAYVAVTGDMAEGLLSVYPVPTQRELNLSYRSAGEGEVTVQVVALDGRVVMESKHMVNVSDNTITLDVSNLPMANYQVKVNNGTEVFTEQFVKQ